MLVATRDIKVSFLIPGGSTSCNDSAIKWDVVQSNNDNRERLTPHVLTLGEDPGVLAALEGNRGICLEGRASGTWWDMGPCKSQACAGPGLHLPMWDSDPRSVHTAAGELRLNRYV